MIPNIWLNLNNVNIFCCHVPNYYRFSGSDMFVILWFPWDRSSDINQLGSLLKGFTGFSQVSSWTMVLSELKILFQAHVVVRRIQVLGIVGLRYLFSGAWEPWAFALNFQRSPAVPFLPHDPFHRLFSQCGSLLFSFKVSKE